MTLRVRRDVPSLRDARLVRALARGLKSLGTRVARAVHRVFRRGGGVLADLFHRRLLRTPREVGSAHGYVLGNTRKHGTAFRGRADGIDPASSGRSLPEPG